MIIRRFGIPVALVAALLTYFPRIACAHPGHGGNFYDGWQHPFTGLDHLLAMMAVGLLAVRVGGRGLWLVPCAFLGAMLAGGLASVAGLSLPGVETGILASVLVFGIMIAATRSAPLWLGMATVATFAVFHGHAHATEMSAGGSLIPYAAGFLIGTAVLHAAGIAAAVALGKFQGTKATRLAGGAIAACGLFMIIGWL